jgi:recombination DNA repair RAD52 pathway protein
MKASISRPKKGERRDLILDINRSIELANYYIGFNQWSSSIVSLTQDAFEYNETTNQYRCVHTCVVRFMLKDGRSTEGKGQGTAVGKEKLNTVEFSKKNAITQARRTMFQSVIIVLLKNGKVAVHVIPKPEEPQEPPLDEINELGQPTALE